MKPDERVIVRWRGNGELMPDSPILDSSVRKYIGPLLRSDAGGR